MNLAGTKELAAPRDVVWAVISDPAQMAQLMPGVESFEIEDDTHWQAKVKVSVGLGELEMAIAFEKLEERPLEFASLKARGKGIGAMMNMTTSFTLNGEGDSTSMDWAADVRIAGPVSSMGQRVLQPIVNQQVANVLQALETMAVGEKSASQSSRKRSVLGAKTRIRLAARHVLADPQRLRGAAIAIGLVVVIWRILRRGSRRGGGGL